MPAQDSSYQTPAPVPEGSPVIKTPPAPGVVGTPETPPPPKKGFPKIALILVVVLGLVALGFLFFKLVLPRIRGEKEVTLTWWGLWEDQTIVAPLITEYQGTHPKVKINYIKQT
ncbi:hypothetical protein E3I18_02155, partial [Candidatus Woesebacteria bacterium]